MEPAATATPPPPATVRDLLEQAAAQVRNQSIGGTTVHAFPDTIPGLEPYLLRIEPGSGFTAHLNSSSSLTPVSNIAMHQRLGQPLTALDDSGQISILLKQPGRSLTQLRDIGNDKPTRTAAEFEAAWLPVLEKIAALPHDAQGGNPLTPLLCGAYASAKSGLLPDLNAGNILLDEAGSHLHLIDQYETPIDRYTPRERLDRATESLHFLLCDQYRYATKSPIAERHTALAELFEGWIVEARQAALATGEQQLSFARVDDIRAVALDAPPQVLVEQLRQLTQRAQLHGR